MEAYSLFEVNQYIKRVLALNFEEPIWVECEINQVSNSRGNIYLELIEKSDDNDEIIAKTAATVWYRQFLFIKKKLNKLTDSILSPGVKVKLKVNITFSERYGMSFNVIDLDPSFTFGQFELNRQKVIEQLKSKNLLNKNAAIPIPTVIQRIAIISSETAAGYHDFINQIHENNNGYEFAIDLYQAAMQGPKTEREVVEALREVNKQDYDIVALIRGGGSKLDLSAFDNYNIAFEIANSPIPVFTGIGHEIDQTVCDLVANQVLKTPTAVAGFIIDHNLDFESEIHYYLQMISQKTLSILDNTKSNLARMEERITALPKNKLNELYLKLNYTDQKITSLVKEKINNKKLALINTEEIIALLEPKNILKRGFTLVKQDDKYITRKSDISSVRKSISLEFYDGIQKI